MAAAANAVIAGRGGMAVAAGGARAGGAAAAGVRPGLGRAGGRGRGGVRAMQAAADAIVDWQPPMLTFKAVVGASLACNPGPHVTDLGITDGSTGEVFPSALIDG